jgi:signal transduction histidine kinase
VPATDLTLSWGTFLHAANPAGISRRYGGIHFKQDDLEARASGRLVGRIACGEGTGVVGVSVAPTFLSWRVDAGAPPDEFVLKDDACEPPGRYPRDTVMLTHLTRRLRSIAPTTADGLLALVLWGSALLVAQQQGKVTPVHLLTISLSTLPVTLRRRYPIAVFWVIGVTLVLNLSAGYANSFFETFALVVAVYSAFVHASWGPWLAVTMAGLAVGLHVSLIIDWHNHGKVTLSDLPYNYLLFVVPPIVGYSVRTRRAYIDEVEEHGRLLVREAATDERSRIARELHDVVAHSVSVMVLQATAASRLARRDPAKASGTFDVIQQTGRQALLDLRRIVGVLRVDGEPEAERLPQPGLAQLETLVDQVRRAGMHVDVDIHGERRPLPPGIELSAYRIVQESLTNVLKHADADHARVAVTYGDNDLDLDVRDDGKGTAATTTAGNGLIGMRERVGLFGGDFNAGRWEGGFRVHARLPLEASSR